MKISRYLFRAGELCERAHCMPHSGIKAPDEVEFNNESEWRRDPAKPAT
jgi:hypothetical protein